MVLVDASVWIDHLRRPIAAIHDLAGVRQLATHALVGGEVAMGSLHDRKAILRTMAKLPALPQATNAEVMAMVEWHQLFSKGIGFVDAHLIASVRLAENCRLWTRDKRLHAQAERLGVAYAG